MWYYRPGPKRQRLWLIKDVIKYGRGNDSEVMIRAYNGCLQYHLKLVAITISGSGALHGKMMLIRIIENNKIDAYFRLIKGYLCPLQLGKRLR